MTSTDCPEPPMTDPVSVTQLLPCPFCGAAPTPDAAATTDPVREAAKPWADYHGDLPDYDHPLRPVYESGIQYSVELLAKELGVTEWVPCDGTEEFDGDLGGTLMNIVLAAMPEDEHGDPIYPRDIPALLAAPDAAASRDTLAIAVDQNDTMRQELTNVGNLVSDLARVMRVDQANDDGSWPDLAGRIQKLIDAAASEAGEVERLREALRPFLAHWRPWMEDAFQYPDYEDTTLFARVNYGDLRRARAALSTQGGEG